jgi:SAM-dependent methyltransferase
MSRTGERRSAYPVDTIEDHVQDLLHRYPYLLVRQFIPKGSKVLEVGFGEGYGAASIRHWVGEYRGVEISRQAVRQALDKYGGDGLEFCHYDGDRLPFPDAYFDAVISFQVIEHVDHPDGLLVEIDRIIRPEAVILLTTPNRNHRLNEGERPWNRYHLREYSPEEFEVLLRGHFADVTVYGVRGSPALEQVERTRVARLRALARRDPWGLRYWIPEPGKRAALWLIDWRRRRRGARALQPAFGPKDVWHTREGLKDSLDLLAIVHKRPPSAEHPRQSEEEEVPQDQL